MLLTVLEFDMIWIKTVNNIFNNVIKNVINSFRVWYDLNKKVIVRNVIWGELLSG